jgi:hypothetical protein
MKDELESKEAKAREAARRLAALGGTMPGLKSVPRRRSKPAEDPDEEAASD